MGKREMKELRKTAILGTAHILRNVLTFTLGNEGYMRYKW